MHCILRPCCQKGYRLVTKLRLKYVLAIGGFVMLLDYFGVFTHLFEVTYDENFVYPYEGDIHEFVHALKHNEKPVVAPINQYNYSYVFDNKQRCKDAGYSSFRVVYIVKSAIEHIERRAAIRKSWGFEKRFFDVPSRTVFLLSVHPDDKELQAKINTEAAKYKDIIQLDCVDNYYNNTIKTMMGFKWLVNNCLNSKFYMFVDDDMYVSVKNVLRFIRNPANYPDYLKEPKKYGAHKREISATEMKEEYYNRNRPTKVTYKSGNKNDTQKDRFNSSAVSSERASLESIPHRIITTFNHSKPNKGQDTQSKSGSLEISLVPSENGNLSEVVHLKTNSVQKAKYNRVSAVPNRTKRQIFDFELPEDVRLFAGFVFVSSPHRHRSSKWYVPYSEYPYHLWPPYVTAGAYILSKQALVDMYYASLYTKHFRFDDIFLGLVAKKANIEPFHCEEFHFYKKDYTKFNYKYVITSHGYSDPNELLYVWNEQKALGNA